MKLVGIFHLARFQTRPNRFLSTVKLENSNEVVEAHVPDPGRLKELFYPDSEVIVRHDKSSNRRTQYSLVGVKTGKIWVNIESIFTNEIFRQEYQKIPKLKNLELVKSEYTFGKSRFDFLMLDKKTNEKILLEIKGVTLVKNQLALFPDAPTVRGARHVQELGEAVLKGWKAHIVFIIKRSDADSFIPNVKMDPKFAEELRKAIAKGVQVTAVICNYQPIENPEINIIREIPLLEDF